MSDNNEGKESTAGSKHQPVAKNSSKTKALSYLYITDVSVPLFLAST